MDRVKISVRLFTKWTHNRIRIQATHHNCFPILWSTGREDKFVTMRIRKAEFFLNIKYAV